MEKHSAFRPAKPQTKRIDKSSAIADQIEIVEQNQRGASIQAVPQSTASSPVASPQPRAIAIDESKGWLQIVVLNKHKEAEAIKSALIELRLRAIIQNFERNKKIPYPVPVAPYQHEGDAHEN